MSAKFKYLFSPLKIGPVTVPNRLMLTGHNTVRSPEGQAYYQAERARGGTGLICYGFGSVYPLENTKDAIRGGFLRLYSPGANPTIIPAFKMITDRVHSYGSKIFYQCGASGMWMGKWGPNPLVDPDDPRMTCAQMSDEQIEAVLDGFRKASENAKKAGFDGIEIHDHGGMVHQFMSHSMNKRKDKWGGSLDNRLRFLYESIKRCREGMSSDMALITRLCVDEFIPNGIGPKEGQEIAQKLEDKVDMLDIDVAIEPEGLNIIVGNLFYDPGYQLYGCEAVKEVIKKIPIGCVGRIGDAIFAEKILADGKADMIGMVRALIADPEFGNKAKAGKLDDIRPCLYENEGCMKTGAHACTVNPCVDHEKAWGIGTITPAEKKKTILVAGAGPAGMEFARTAAMRGHNVTVYEKSNDVGGAINLAMKLPGRMEYDSFKRWLKLQLDKSGVKLVLNKEVTPELVKNANPDVVVVATGARPFRDGFNSLRYDTVEGYDKPNVCLGEDILEGKVDINKLGPKVIIYDQVGYDEALGLAEMLIDAGKTVDIRSPGHYVGGADVYLTFQKGLVARAMSKGAKLSPYSILAKVDGKTGSFVNSFTHDEFEETADSFVLCVSKRANDELFWQLRDAGYKEDGNLFRLGDANSPHNISDAVFYGHKLAREL